MQNRANTTAWQHGSIHRGKMTSVMERGESRQSILRYEIHWHAAVRGCEACILCAMRAMCAQYGVWAKYLTVTARQRRPILFFLPRYPPIPLSPASTDSGPLANPTAAQAISLVSSSVVRLVIRLRPSSPAWPRASIDRCPTRSLQKYMCALILWKRYILTKWWQRNLSHRNR